MIEMFTITSSYSGIEMAEYKTADGRITVYLRRRLVPPPERFEFVKEHSVAEGDRLDNIAAQYLGDPEQFWRICDANRAMNPEDLTQEICRILRIPLPEGG